MRKAQPFPRAGLDNLKCVVVILQANIPGKNRSSGALRRSEGTVGRLRLSDDAYWASLCAEHLLDVVFEVLFEQLQVFNQHTVGGLGTGVFSPSS